MYRAGIDEAGRGPLIGPLVAALVVIDADAERFLAAQGVTDSKKLSAKKREALAPLIRERAMVAEVVIAQPERIDAALDDPRSNLNRLEAELTAELLAFLPEGTGTIAIDLPSRNAASYREDILSFGALSEGASLILEHKADLNHISCAAASILAKVERDRLIRELERAIGIPIGSGYPSDPITKAFLERHGRSHAHVFRKTWSSYASRYSGQHTLV
jgi:ribonuclease HII